MTDRKQTVVFKGAARAANVAAALATAGLWFQIEPYPDDHFRIDVKAEPGAAGVLGAAVHRAHTAPAAPPDTAPLLTDARELLRRLNDWQTHMGGWDAPVWADLLPLLARLDDAIPPTPECCERAAQGDGTCPRCFVNTGAGCEHGDLCPDCTAEVVSLPNWFLTRLHSQIGDGRDLWPGFSHAENVDGDEIRVVTHHGPAFFVTITTEDERARDERRRP